MSKKKVGIIIAVAVVVVAVAGGGLWYFLSGKGSGGKSADKVYVESVASLVSADSGVQNRYSGVVEPQETWEVNKNGEKTVKEVFVAEGDAVEVGTPLFEYDTEALESELAQAKLDLEGMQNDITNYQAQIKQLNEEKSTAPEDEKFNYTTQIQSLQNSIKQSEYNIQSKKIEMQKKQEAIDNSTVNSEIAGVVKSINENGVDASGNASAYMTILATGDYRIKGTVSEQNIASLSQGQSVIIRSRIDEEQVWNGTISKVDMENQETNTNNYMESESGMTSAKYPFYVTLNAADGLILGQHVYIELDEGQNEAKEGIWLFEGYIGMDEEEPYVWAANDKDKLEKRRVELGEYDEELGEYEIKSGLSEEDYIAYPMFGLYEGVTTVTDAAEVDYSSPLYNQEGGMEDEMMEDEVIDDTMLPEDEVPEDEMLPEGGSLEDGAEESIEEPVEEQPEG
ncbi:efflux RND transporter periplasmic adaptor subunit [Roseburia sp. 499]|uniref:efflux RND transporter periplasmic adaptor subunit n=1 Tax=Roseburia sp. 499 TaxID=1261634 RepID=UPI0009513414|nr:efflux RND transporter periplasmic adaptor subunit [Roseburia sp. 499]WVK68923.1 efflux RND transporter periplasmic adaptor subunit [Roseburia sp. 499]